MYKLSSYVEKRVCAVDNGRDHIRQYDAPTSLRLSEQLLGADNLSNIGRPVPGSSAQYPSSLPAPPRVSDLLPPPPRVDTNMRDVDMYDAAPSQLSRSRLMPDNQVSHRQGFSNLPVRQNQRGFRDRHVSRLNSGRDARSGHLDHIRHVSPDKWHYKRQWYNPARDRNYPPRRYQHESGKSSRNNEETEDSWQPDDANINQLHDEDNALPPQSEIPRETVSLSNDKECNDASSTSAVSRPETVLPS